MKNILDYYYHFANISLHYNNGVYSFEKNNHLYLFKEFNRALDELKQISQLLLVYPSKYHKVVSNRDNQLFTVVDNKIYVLFECSIVPSSTISGGTLLYKEKLMIDSKNFSLLYRTDWVKLWSQKIDYFEYQIRHIEEKYPLLSSSIHYFIGLAENAISYVEDTVLHEKPQLQDQVVISHIRVSAFMNFLDYYDPVGIVLDHRARDVASYLKSLFYHGDYTEENIYSFLKQLQFSKYGYRLLIGRLLYPSYYFDLYDQIILGIRQEKEIKIVIKQVEDYRNYVKMIYNYVNTIVEIPRIDWL